MILALVLVFALCSCHNEMDENSSIEPTTDETSESVSQTEVDLSQKKLDVEKIVDYVKENGASDPKGTSFSISDQEKNIEIIAKPNRYSSLTFRWSDMSRGLSSEYFSKDITVTNQNGNLVFEVGEDTVACYYYISVVFLKGEIQNRVEFKSQIDLKSQKPFENLSFEPSGEYEVLPFSDDKAIEQHKTIAKEFFEDINYLLVNFDCDITLENFGY